MCFVCDDSELGRRPKWRGVTRYPQEHCAESFVHRKVRGIKRQRQLMYVEAI